MGVVVGVGWSFLGVYFLGTFGVFCIPICVLCMGYFSYPCIRNARLRQLKEGRLYSGLQLGNVVHYGQESIAIRS